MTMLEASACLQTGIDSSEATASGGKKYLLTQNLSQLASASFGQTFNITIQLITAVSVLQRGI
jgi:hypothetical protein